MNQCVTCDMAFKTRKTLRVHEQRGNCGKAPVCETCDKVFKTDLALKNHKCPSISHKCGICNKYYRTERQLKCHQVVHDLACRAVRLGNIKVLRPQGQPRVTSRGLVCRVPARASTGTLSIRLSDITKVQVAFGKSMPFLYLHLSEGACVSIWHQLKMADTDVAVLGETQRRLTVLLERLTQGDKDKLKQLFQDKLHRIKMEDAIEILVRPSPSNIATLKAKMLFAEDNSNQRDVVVEQEKQSFDAMELEELEKQAAPDDQQQEQTGKSREQVGQESQKSRDVQEVQEVIKPAELMVRREREGRWAVEAAISRTRSCVKVEVVGEVVEERLIREYSVAEVERGRGKRRSRRQLSRHTAGD